MSWPSLLSNPGKALAETWDDRWLFSYYPFTGTKCIFEDAGTYAVRAREAGRVSDRTNFFKE